MRFSSVVVPHYKTALLSTTCQITLTLFGAVSTSAIFKETHISSKYHLLAQMFAGSTRSIGTVIFILNNYRMKRA